MRLAVAAAGPLATVALLGGCGASTAGVALFDVDASVSAAASNPVTVSPLPGTPDASPTTQISFLGRHGTRVWDVRVVGSRSGPHPGRLGRYSTGTGASFLPAAPFLAGERVTVTAHVRAEGRDRLARTSFTVGRPVAVTANGFPALAGDPSQVQRYASAPTLTPSSVRIITPAAPGASPGDLFLAPYQGSGTAGPMIVTQAGQLVWFHPLPAGVEATNFGVQRYRGAPVLTWWQGRIIELGFGQGEDVIYDDTYRPIATVRAGNGYEADLHCFRLSAQGTAWLEAFAPVHADMSAVGGPSDGVLTDAVVQEVDVRTGLVMWEWHALGHVPLSDSKNPLPGGSYPWDYVHINSIDPSSDGAVLLSFRNTWSVEQVDLHSGGVRWRLGGARSTFKQGPGATFYWQHDAQLLPGGMVSLFDNGSDPPEEKQSRGLLISIDARARRASVRAQFANPTRTLLAASQGNLRPLPRGNWLIGYGRLPEFTEFDRSGRVLLDGSLGPNVQSFSVDLAPWRARAAPGVPAIALGRAPGGGLTLAVSWNGATDVAAWRVLSGRSPARLSAARTVASSGFQTSVQLRAAAYVRVQALASDGRVLGASATLHA